MLYRRQQKFPEWKATLEEAIKHPTAGLENARANHSLADYHIGRREWRAALPFAESAATSFSEWGLLGAAACHEAMQNWKRAEAYYGAASARYRNVHWFYFTVRTGEGDKKGAEASAKELLDSARTQGNVSAAHIFFALANGDLDFVRKVVEGIPAKERENPQFPTLLALIYDENGETEKRDDLLKQLLSFSARPETRNSGPTAALREVTRLIVDDLGKAGKADFDVESLVPIRKRCAETLTLFPFDYTLGRYCELHDNAATFGTCQCQPTLCFAVAFARAFTLRTFFGSVACFTF